MSLISGSHSRTKGSQSRDKNIQFLENIRTLTIVRQPANVTLPAFIRRQKLSVQSMNHFHILDENEQKILTAIEIDTSRQLQNFKYILNIFSPDGKLLAAVVQRKKLPTKLHGDGAGDPSPYFRMDQLLPSKLILCFHSCRGYYCKRLYEYNSMNPTAHSHVQWGTGDLLGHIWEGHDHVVALKANLDPVYGISPICHDRNGDWDARPKFLITTYDAELASRPMGFDVLTLQDIRCGIKSHRLVTRNLFPIRTREQDIQVGVLEVSDPRHSSLPRNELDGRDIVDVFFPADIDAPDKLLILCAAFTRFFRSSAPIITRCPDDSRKLSYWKVVFYVLISGSLLGCMIAVAFVIIDL